MVLCGCHVNLRVSEGVKIEKRGAHINRFIYNHSKGRCVRATVLQANGRCLACFLARFAFFLSHGVCSACANFCYRMGGFLKRCTICAADKMPMAPPPPGQGGPADGPQAWYMSLPIITRAWFTACVASTVYIYVRSCTCRFHDVCACALRVTSCTFAMYCPVCGRETWSSLPWFSPPCNAG